jgi:hypothetical protein
MTDYERELNFKVIKDCKGEEILTLLYNIYRHKRAIAILEYCVKNNITGTTFLGEIKVRHRGSLLNFMAEIVKKIDRDVVKRAIIVGKDWA